MKNILKNYSFIICMLTGIAAEHDDVQQTVAHQTVTAVDAANGLTGNQQVGDSLGEAFTADLQTTDLIVRRGIYQNRELSHINAEV